MTPPPASVPRPVTCREPGCTVRIHFARHYLTGRLVPLEVVDRDPASQAATGAYVVVSRQAWRKQPLIEDFMARFRVTEPKARELADGYPHHQPHSHP